MNCYKSSYNLIIVFFFLSIVTSCHPDDEFSGRERIPLFSEVELSKIHGDSEKSWRIVELINKNYDPRDHLEIELSCLTDDVYTFHSANNKFTVDLGSDKCFGTNDDGIFTADKEIFDGELVFIDASQGKTIYLRYSRGFLNQNGTAAGVSIRYYALAELSESRMVFHRSGGKFIGEYREALIFEKVQD